MKKFITGIIVGSIISSTLFTFAEMQSIQAFFNDIKIQINGKIVDTGADKPFIYNGRTYVPTRYIAEGLGATVKWNETSNTVEVDSENLQQNQTASSNQNIKTGGVKGSVTWQYNNYIGTKPDVGAKIYLFRHSTKDKYNNISALDINRFQRGRSFEELGLFVATANGFGNYEIINLPADRYTVLLVSENTTRSPNTNMSAYKYLLDPMWNTWEHFETIFLFKNKFNMEYVEIKEDKTLDVSYDFGNTY